MTAPIEMLGNLPVHAPTPDRRRALAVLTMLAVATIVAIAFVALFLRTAQDPRQVVVLRVGEEVNAFAFGPHGDVVATATDDGIHVWTYPGLEPRWNVAAPGALAIAWSPDGRYLATDSGDVRDNAVQIFRSIDHALVSTLPGHQRVVFRLAWSPDGTLLASAGHDGTARLWRVRDGIGTFVRVVNDVDAVAFSPDSQFVATADTHHIFLWRVGDGGLVNTIQSSKQIGLSLAYSPDGRWLASPGGSDVIPLWRVDDGTILRELGPTTGAEQTAFSPESRYLAAAEYQSEPWWLPLPLWLPLYRTSVPVWRVADGQLVARLDGLRGHVRTVAWSPDGQIVAAGGQDGMVRFWRVPGARQLVRRSAW